MEQSPLEYNHPTISEVQVKQITLGMRSISFTMTTAGKNHSVIIWNPQLVNSGESELQTLSEKLLNDCFTDCDVCSVFQSDTNKAKMEFHKNDAHKIVRSTRIQIKPLI